MKYIIHNREDGAIGTFNSTVTFNGEGCIGLGIPDVTGDMVGANAITALPESKQVLKFDLNGYGAGEQVKMAQER